MWGAKTFQICSVKTRNASSRASRGYGIMEYISTRRGEQCSPAGCSNIKLNEGCANKISYRATSIPFLCTEQRNGRKKIGIRAAALMYPANSRPLPSRIACGRAAQFAGAGGIHRQANLCFRRLEVRTAKSEKLTRVGIGNFLDWLGENLLRLKPRERGYGIWASPPLWGGWQSPQAADG